MNRRLLVITTLLMGCQEGTLIRRPPPPVATPPSLPSDGLGDPPNWNDCFEGFVGSYHNLVPDDPFVSPDPEATEPEDLVLDDLPWWEEQDFQSFHSNLDFGNNWWPVDEGLEGDPGQFSVQWNAWLRAWDDTTMTFTLGAADDVWILLGDEVVFSDVGIKDFEPQTYSIPLEAGQYPLEIRFAHRDGESGFRFRVLTGDVSTCYAEFSED